MISPLFSAEINQLSSVFSLFIDKIVFIFTVGNTLLSVCMQNNKQGRRERKRNADITLFHSFYKE